jgi:hypothetical protein
MWPAVSQSRLGELVADGLGEGLTVGLVDAVGVSDAVAVALALEVAVGVALALEVAVAVDGAVAVTLGVGVGRRCPSSPHAPSTRAQTVRNTERRTGRGSPPRKPESRRIAAPGLLQSRYMLREAHGPPAP